MNLEEIFGLSGEAKSVTEALLVVGTLFFWNWFIDWLNFHVPALHHVLEPPPLPLIRDGRLLRRNMRHEFISPDELRSKLREHGVTDPAQVEKAYLEPDGEVSVIKKPQSRSSAPAASHR